MIPFINIVYKSGVYDSKALYLEGKHSKVVCFGNVQCLF